MGNEQDGVPPEETEIETPEIDEEHADDEFHPFDEMREEYKPTRTQKVMGDDGLPTQDAEVIDGDIPILSTDTLVCMGDFSLFVRRDSLGRVRPGEEYEPVDVIRVPNGKWYLKYEVENAGREGHKGEKELQEVVPLRPACKHYVRQMGQGGDNPNMKVHYRLCAARRTTEGAFMTVRDTGLWACSMREPRDVASEERRLEKFDEMKIQQGATRVSHSIFGNPKEG